jgi:hypothetical protein
MKRILLVALLSVFMIGSVRAEIIAECGASAGYSFYLQGPNVPANKSGWTDDKISKGSTSIVLIDDKFDVLFSDGNSKNKSSRADGAQVILLGVNSTEKSFSLLVVYKGNSAEIYTYHGLSKTLIQQPARYNAAVNSTKMMVSKCK